MNTYTQATMVARPFAPTEGIRFTFRSSFIEGLHGNYRLVGLEDAGFIVRLRTDPSRSKHIHATSKEIEAQMQWTRKYLDRHAQGRDFYFVATDKTGEPCGTVRLCEVDGVRAQSGSWVMRPGCPLSIALESYLVPGSLAFHILKLTEVVFDVRIENRRVWKFHESCGAEFLRENSLDRFYRTTPAIHDHACGVIARLLRMLQTDAQPPPAA